MFPKILVSAHFQGGRARTIFSPRYCEKRKSVRSTQSEFSQPALVAWKVIPKSEWPFPDISPPPPPPQRFWVKGGNGARQSNDGGGGVATKKVSIFSPPPPQYFGGVEEKAGASPKKGGGGVPRILRQRLSVAPSPNWKDFPRERMAFSRYGARRSKRPFPDILFPQFLVRK